MNKIFFLLVLALPQLAFAATRTVHFDQTAQNYTGNGLVAGSSHRSTCTIIINNPSDNSQNVSMELFATYTGSGAGNATMTAATGLTNPSPGRFVLSAQPLAGGGILKYEFQYPVFPTGGGTGSQFIFCRGTITSTDTSAATPGFIMASGTIVSFSESSIVQTAGATSTSTVYSGNVVYTQVPITINRGKPF